MWSDDETEGTRKKGRELLELWDLLNDPGSQEVGKTESPSEDAPKNVADRDEKLILRRRRPENPFPGDPRKIDGWYLE